MLGDIYNGIFMNNDIDEETLSAKWKAFKNASITCWINVLEFVRRSCSLSVS